MTTEDERPIAPITADVARAYAKAARGELGAVHDLPGDWQIPFGEGFEFFEESESEESALPWQLWWDEPLFGAIYDAYELEDEAGEELVAAIRDQHKDEERYFELDLSDGRFLRWGFLSRERDDGVPPLRLFTATVDGHHVTFVDYRFEDESQLGRALALWLATRREAPLTPSE